MVGFDEILFKHIPNPIFLFTEQIGISKQILSGMVYLGRKQQQFPFQNEALHINPPPLQKEAVASPPPFQNEVLHPTFQNEALHSPPPFKMKSLHPPLSIHDVLRLYYYYYYY